MAVLFFLGACNIWYDALLLVLRNCNASLCRSQSLRNQYLQIRRLGSNGSWQSLKPSAPIVSCIPCAVIQSWSLGYHCTLYLPLQWSSDFYKYWYVLQNKHRSYRQFSCLIRWSFCEEPVFFTSLLFVFSWCMIGFPPLVSTVSKRCLDNRWLINFAMKRLSTIPTILTSGDELTRCTHTWTTWEMTSVVAFWLLLMASLWDHMAFDGSKFSWQISMGVLWGRCHLMTVLHLRRTTWKTS